MRASASIGSAFVALGRGVVLLMALGLSPGAMAVGQGGLEGVWLTADGSTRVRFEACSQAVCGHIVWLKEPVDPATGRPWLDGKNEDAGLRNRPLIGLPMITGVKPEGGGAWSASLYNPLDGKTYSGVLTRLSADRLQLRGCALVVFCQDEVWSRLP
jgi:uncharacterized protein (DUF2147 family)